MTTVSPESPEWRKSSHSDNGGACIEVAANLATSRGIVPVRDSKDPTGPALVFTLSTWSSFVEAVRRGELHS